MFTLLAITLQDVKKHNKKTQQLQLQLQATSRGIIHDSKTAISDMPNTSHQEYLLHQSQMQRGSRVRQA